MISCFQCQRIVGEAQAGSCIYRTPQGKCWLCLQSKIIGKTDFSMNETQKFSSSSDDSNGNISVIFCCFGFCVPIFSVFFEVLRFLPAFHVRKDTATDILPWILKHYSDFSGRIFCFLLFIKISRMTEIPFFTCSSVYGLSIDG